MGVVACEGLRQGSTCQLFKTGDPTERPHILNRRRWETAEEFGLNLSMSLSQFTFSQTAPDLCWEEFNLQHW